MFQWLVSIEAMRWCQCKSLSLPYLPPTKTNTDDTSFSVKPVEKDDITFYQIQPGSDYEIKFNFSANPEPMREVWKFGEDLANPEGILNIPSDEGRYSASMAVRKFSV